MADVFSRAVAELDVDSTRLKAGLIEADATVKRQVSGTERAAAQQTSRFSAQTQQQITRGMAVAGAAVGTFIAGSTQEFGRFQEGMNEVFTLIPGVTKDAMASMTDDVLAFSRATGKLPEEVIPALYQALSAGVPPDNVFDFLRTANEAAVGGVAKTSEAVNLLSAVTKGYGDTSTEATRIAGNLALETVRLGQTTFPELASSIGQVIPLASALGVKQEELFAATASLSGVTGSTSMVMTQLKAALTAVVKPNADMARVMKDLGYESGEAMINSLGLAGTLDALTKASGGSQTELANMFGQTEALTAVLALGGPQAATYAKNLDQMTAAAEKSGTGADALTVAYERMDSGVAAAGRKILANVKTMAIGIGEQLQGLGPVFTAFGPMAGRAIGAGFGALGGIITGKLVPAIIAAQVPGMAAGTTVGTAMGSATATAYLRALILGDRIAALIGRIPGGAAVQGALTRAGTAMGSKMSLAIGAGMVIGVAAIADQVYPSLQKLGSDIGAKIRPQFLTDFGRELSNFNRDMPWPIGMKDAPDWAGVASTAGAGATTVGRAITTHMASAVKDDALVGPITAATDRGADALAAGGPKMTAGWSSTMDYLRDALPGATQGASDEARRQGNLLGLETAQGILDKQQAPVDAWDQLDAILKAAMKPTAEAGRLTGRLMSQKLADAMNDSRPAVRQAAAETKQVMLDRLTELGAGGARLSKKTAAEIEAGLKSKNPTIRKNAEDAKVSYLAGLQQYVDGGGRLSKGAAKAVETGLKSNNPAIRRAAEGIRDAAAGPMKSLPDKGYGWGSKFGAQYAAGIRSMSQVVARAAAGLATKVGQQFILRSPAEEGALSTYGGPEGWGRKFGEMYARGARSALPSVEDLLGQYSSPNLAGSLGILSATGSLGTATLRLDITPESAAALRDAGYDASQVGDAVLHGLDATGLLANLRHVAAVRGG